MSEEEQIEAIIFVNFKYIYYKSLILYTEPWNSGNGNILGKCYSKIEFDDLENFARYLISKLDIEHTNKKTWITHI